MTRKRQNFPKSVQRAAWERANGVCEAVGVLYGLKPNTRCANKLDKGVHYDHILADSNGGKPTLENCAATCPKCNMHKAHKHDTPRAAKGLRQQDKARGITKPMKAKIPNKPFPKAIKAQPSPKEHFGSKGHAHHQAEMERLGKRVPPRRFK